MLATAMWEYALLGAVSVEATGEITTLKDLFVDFSEKCKISQFVCV